MPKEKPITSNPLPINYVPAGGIPYRVKDDDDWYSVAAKFSIGAKALIRFNFHTNNTDEVNWYLRRNVGCNKPTKNKINWMFSSAASPGIIYIPPLRPLPLALRTITRSIATVSWLDPRPGNEIKRPVLLARKGHQFVNFLEASITVMDTNNGGMMHVSSSDGFTRASGLYASHPKIPFYQYPIRRSSRAVNGGVRFTQTVGVRDQDAEVSIGKGVPPNSWLTFAHRLLKLGMAHKSKWKIPPIWTELELTIYFDGTYDVRVNQSLFPNVGIYYGGRYVPAMSFDGGKTFSPVRPLNPDEKVADYYKAEVYENGIYNFSRWQSEGWGGGNPWGASYPDNNLGEPTIDERGDITN